ncbi:MAG TPA: efflux RND transporter periplasmic adaptor subunit [Bryobacteraceae bacterium]|jgi:HlyD family secretion protein|nr:efflux RND transporter periplasmic adaptor subunit [Bryobacteraceae bacterium]
MKKALVWLVILAGLGGAGVWLWKARQVQAKADLPVASARRGEFQVIVRCRGELVSTHSVQLVAPMHIAGLQIAWQAPPNSEVKEGDVVIRFDSSLARQQLLEKQATLKQAQATVQQTVAQARITSEQDQLDLASARVALEKAKLEASKQELVSKLQGEESRIDLGLAEENLKAQIATIDLHKTSDAQKVGSATRLRDKAQEEIDVTTDRLAHMEMHAPSAGVIVYVNNFSQGWINAKPFKVGDSVWPGSVVGEIPDVTTLQMKAKLEETDRGRIAAGQDARILVDPFPEKPFPGKVASISPLVEQEFDWPPTRNFRAMASFNEPDRRLRPAMNARVDFIVERIPDAISVPASAVFTRQGRPAVYVAEKNAWMPHEVEILARNPDEVAINGITEGTKVSLVEPDAVGTSNQKKQ